PTIPILPSFPTRRSSDLTITITSLPGTGKAVTYTFSHQSATGTGSNTFSPTFNPNAAAVVFSVPSVTVKNDQSAAVDVTIAAPSDRKSTRLNSSHVSISY